MHDGVLLLYGATAPHVVSVYIMCALAIAFYCVWAESSALWKWLLCGYYVLALMIDLVPMSQSHLGAKLLAIPLLYIIAYFLIFRRLERTRW